MQPTMKYICPGSIHASRHSTGLQGERGRESDKEGGYRPRRSHSRWWEVHDCRCVRHVSLIHLGFGHPLGTFEVFSVNTRGGLLQHSPLGNRTGIRARGDVIPTRLFCAKVFIVTTSYGHGWIG